MKFHLTVIFFLFTSFLFAQTNLVPNPSFENYSWVSIPSLCDTSCTCINWYSPTNGTPDYYNKNTDCFPEDVPLNTFGYQNPKSGKAYYGLLSRAVSLYFPDHREYIQSKLIDTLKNGIKYCVSFYVNLADSSQYATDGIEAYFSDSSVTHFDSTGLAYLLNYNPQVFNPHGNIITDKQNWTLISDSFVAKGGEQYITIGNFWDDTNTDTILVGGASYHMGEPFSYYYIDDVSVVECSSGINSFIQKQYFNIFPNPATNELTIDFALIDKSYFELFDILGAKRKAVTLDCGSRTKRIDLTDIDAGLYFYSVVDRNGNRIKTGKLTVIK
jgi:hypothetical protein